MKAQLIEFQMGKVLPKEDFDKIAPAVSEGRLVVFPTEVSYILGGDAFNKNLVARVRTLYPDEVPLALYISSITEFRLYTVPVLPRLRRALERCLPGPYGLVVRATQAAPRRALAAPARSRFTCPPVNRIKCSMKPAGAPWWA
jgi:tRNA A37 threonylcarbamoyladenosine synthetase subunit TsaC/SUA5/YrdC